MKILNTLEAKNFVQNTGWLMLVLSILVMLISGFQAAVLAVLFTIQPDLREGIIMARSDTSLPPAIRYIMGYGFEFMLLSFALGIAALISSIGFIKYRFWAWCAFLIFAILSVFGNLFGAWATWFAPPIDLSFLQEVIPNMPIDLNIDDGSARWSGVLFSLFFAVGFAWMTKRILEPGVRELFSQRKPLP